MQESVPDAPSQPQQNEASNRRLLEAETLTSSSALENLPAELRLKVLMSMPDLPTLKAIVHASPIMHSQYLHGRNDVLHACLGRELDGFFVDAYAALRSRVSQIGSLRNNETILEFLNSYYSWLWGPDRPGMRSASSGELRWLARYHLHIVRPIAHMYSKWALDNLNKEIAYLRGKGAETKVHAELRRSEEIRIFRAIYRNETFHHLFGFNNGHRDGRFCNHEINDLFFGMFNHWEAEEMGCIDLFIRDKYQHIINRVKDDLIPSNPKLLQDNTVSNFQVLVDIARHDDGEYDWAIPQN